MDRQTSAVVNAAREVTRAYYLGRPYAGELAALAEALARHDGRGAAVARPREVRPVVGAAFVTAAIGGIGGDPC